jgi:hypothetical protein
LSTTSAGGVSRANEGSSSIELGGSDSKVIERHRFQ